MICVDHLCYHYKGGRPILRDVSFELETGHFLAVLGNNGVGKSTLLKCMNRILTADSGHCRIDGEDLLTLSHREIAKRVAFVAQHVPDTQMTVHDMVMLGRRPYMTWGVTEHDHHVLPAPPAVESTKVGLTSIETIIKICCVRIIFANDRFYNSCHLLIIFVKNITKMFFRNKKQYSQNKYNK